MPRRGLAIAAAILLLLAAAVVWAAPAIAERFIADKLAAAGFADASFDLAGLSLHGVTLANVRIGDRLSIDRVEVDIDLHPARAKEIRAIGARWAVRTSSAGLDLAPFDRFRFSGKGRPLDRIEIRDSALAIKGLVLPVSATIEMNDPRLSIVLAVAGDLQLTATGTIDRVQRRIDRLQLDGRYREIALSAHTAGDSIQWNVTAQLPGVGAGSASGSLSQRWSEWRAPLVADVELTPEDYRMTAAGHALIYTDPPHAELDLTAKGDLSAGAITLERVVASAKISAFWDRGDVAATIEKGKASIARARLGGARFDGVRVVAAGGEISRDEELAFTSKQSVTWKKVMIGTLDLGHGSMKLLVRSPRTIVVQSAESHPADGGTVRVGRTKFTLGDPHAAFELMVDDLSMQRWLALVGRDKVTGEGRLSGRIPVRLVLGRRPRVELGRGQLIAMPGAKVRVKDLTTAGALLAQAGLNESIGEVVKDRLLEALEELELSKLEFQLVPRAGDVDLTVLAAGRGTRGARQEIGGLTINFHNFGTGLNQLLRFEAEASRLKARTKEELNDPILELFQ